MNATISIAAGRCASELWTEKEYQNLLFSLHDPNPPAHFAFSMVPKDDFQAIFKHNKSRTVDGAIASTWRSICHESDRPYALVLLPSAERESIWAAWDFDFHDDPRLAMSADMHRNLLVFVREARHLTSAGIHYIVEHSGNGWHCWLIGDKARKEKVWADIRRRVESAAVFSREPEFLPHYGGAGKGCRAPGSSNPKTWHVTREDWQNSLIFWHNLPPERVQLKRRISFPSSCTASSTDAENGDGERTGNLADDLAAKWEITKEHERHKRTLGLVGEGCFGFCKAVLRAATIQAHRQARPPCATPLDEHLADFELIYAGAWEKLVLPRLSDQERAALEAFENQSERDAFIICQNHARHGRGTFFFSLRHLAKCIGLSVGRVAQIRKTFKTLKIIEKMPGGYIPGRKAYSFRWLLPMR